MPSPQGDNEFVCVCLFSHITCTSQGRGWLLCVLNWIDKDSFLSFRLLKFKSIKNWGIFWILQHLFLTWPLQSSTLGPRCVHTNTHVETNGAAEHKLCSFQPCFKAASDFLAHHMTEPRDGFSPHICVFASRMFYVHTVRAETARALQQTIYVTHTTCWTKGKKTCCLGNTSLKSMCWVAMGNPAWNLSTIYDHIYCW